jgi:hypothetical protein
MAYQDFKMQILNAAFNLAGTVITQTMKGGIDKYEELSNQYYQKTSKIVEKSQKEAQKERRYEFEKEEKEPVIEYVAVPKKDLSSDKIEKGTACLACSKDHFSTASGALSEALRFARKEGVNHPEVQSRLGIATDELNIMERIDLSAEKLIRLEGHEKKIAIEALKESRDLRHNIMAVKTPDDLERAAADAARIRTHFMKNVFTLAMRDGTVDKLCRNFTGEEKDKCMKTLTAILEEKKESEMK